MKGIIFNATQHVTTYTQKMSGVVDLPDDIAAEIKSLMTFNKVPDKSLLQFNAATIAYILNAYLHETHHVLMNKTSEYGDNNNIKVMIGGAPYFMPYLENALKTLNITPVYAFSKRVSKEYINESGDVVKEAIFTHEGFVYA